MHSIFHSTRKWTAKSAVLHRNTSKNLSIYCAKYHFNCCLVSSLLDMILDCLQRCIYFLPFNVCNRKKRLMTFYLVLFEKRHKMIRKHKRRLMIIYLMPFLKNGTRWYGSTKGDLWLFILCHFWKTAQDDT
jgi:hypothetical protein